MLTGSFWCEYEESQRIGRVQRSVDPLPSGGEDKCYGQMLDRCSVKGGRGKIRFKIPSDLNWDQTTPMAHVNLQSHGLFNLPSNRPDNIKVRADSLCALEFIIRNRGLTKAGMYAAAFRTNDDTVRVCESRWPMHTIFSVSDKEKRSKKSCSSETPKGNFKRRF